MESMGRARAIAPPWSGEWFAFVWSSVPGVALAAAAATGAVSEAVALGCFAISFVGLNLMHFGATWLRVYVRPGWRVHPLERLAIPVTLATFAIFFEAVGGGALLLTAQYFLSFHHALMQNYGLLRVSHRRTGRRIDVRLDLAACLLLPGAALLYRASTICDRYSGALLPALPMPFLELMGMLGVLALAAVAGREWRSYRRSEPVEPLTLGILFGTNLMWSAVLIGSPHPAIPIYAYASGHYAQYLFFVWQVERRDAPLTAEMPVRRRVLTQLRSSRPSYLLMLLLLGGSVALLLTFASVGARAAAEWLSIRPDDALAIPPWAAAIIGVNLEHYWLDSRIWRSPRTLATVPAIPSMSVS
jgi:hypothetical protein